MNLLSIYTGYALDLIIGDPYLISTSSEIYWEIN